MNFSLKKKLFPKVKNIVFDLGGVIINIDYQITINAFKQLGIANYDGSYTQLYSNALFDNNEKGLITHNQFIEGLQKMTQQKVSPLQIINAWNAMLLDLPPKRVALLQSLKHNYRTFLLSNTNQTHLNYFFNYIQTNFSGLQFNSLFENTHYSCQMGMRKPNVEIFEAVLTQNNLVASETLFIDDIEHNLEGALKAGMQVYHLPKGHDLFEIVDLNKL